MSRTTLFTASQPSQRLAPYTPRSPPSPPAALLESLSRSSSLRSEKAQSPIAVSKSISPSISPKSERSPVSTPLLNIQSPTGYSSRTSSLKPKLLPAPIHPRRRSWFREEDPSAFEPPSPNPLALSPMATLRSSMSEDEERDEIYSVASSRSPASLYSLSPRQPYPPPAKKQLEIETAEQIEYRPFSIVHEDAFLALPSRTRSDSARSNRSNPAVVINGAWDHSDIPRRASEGGCESTRVLYYDTGFERSGSQAFGTKPRDSKSAWERSFRRTQVA